MWFIVEERRLAYDPAPPATRRADGGCGPPSAALLVNDGPHRLLVAPRMSARKRSQRNATNLRRTTLVKATHALPLLLARSRTHPANPFRDGASTSLQPSAAAERRRRRRSDAMDADAAGTGTDRRGCGP